MTSLVIRQGDDTTIRIPNVRDANDMLITNWAGFSVHAQIRDRPESPVVLHEWTSPTNVTFVGSDVLLAISGTTTATFTWTHARFDAKLIGPTGKPATIAEDHIVVERQTTR